MRILLFLFFLALAVALFLAGVYIVSINLNDMVTNGVNFWNTFWIMLVLSGVGGGILSRK